MKNLFANVLVIPSFLLLATAPNTIQVQVNGGATQTVQKLNFVNGNGTTTAVKVSNGIALIRYNSVQPATLKIPEISTYKGVCSVGQLFIDGSQPANQQISVCSSPNALTKQFSLYDASVASTKEGSFYVNTGVIASLSDQQTFTGAKQFRQPIDLPIVPAIPTPPPIGFARCYVLQTDFSMHCETPDGVQH